ncbi:unnamed protein product [Prunus armeniaca]
MKAISGEHLRHSGYIPSTVEARYFVLPLHGLDLKVYVLEDCSMSDSESRYDSEPNAFDGESSDNRKDTSSEALSFNSASNEDTEVEILGERVDSVPSHGRGKGLITGQAIPLAVVPYGFQSASTSQYCEFLMRDTRAPDHHVSYQSETSTSSRGDVVAESSSRPIITIVNQGNPRIPLWQPKEHLFGVDYLEPNKITERELAKYRAEYRIPSSVKWRISEPTKSISNPKDSEVVFFTDILQHGVRLPLQPPI